MAKKKKPSGRAVASGQEPAQPKRRRIGSRPPLPPKVSPPGGTRLSRWQRRLDQLREFKREHGHCAVPREHPGSLGTWVRWVRQRRRRGELSEERVRQLDVLGFLWIGGRGHASAMAWRRRIEQLKQFRKEHGHCIVPDPYAPDRAFGWWGRNMRHQRRHGRLSEERFRQLDALGFAWVVTWDGPQVWELCLRELRRYRKEQGHCQVPDRYPPNRALGRWARHLRTARKYGTLPEDKVRRLDTLGFAWDGPPKYWESSGSGTLRSSSVSGRSMAIWRCPTSTLPTARLVAGRTTCGRRIVGVASRRNGSVNSTPSASPGSTSAGGIIRPSGSGASPS